MYPNTRSSRAFIQDILGRLLGYCYDGLAVTFRFVDSGGSRILPLQLAIALRCRTSGLKFGRFNQPFVVSGPAV